MNTDGWIIKSSTNGGLFLVETSNGRSRVLHTARGMMSDELLISADSLIDKGFGHPYIGRQDLLPLIVRQVDTVNTYPLRSILEICVMHKDVPCTGCPRQVDTSEIDGRKLAAILRQLSLRQ